MSVKSAKRRRPEVGVCQVSQQARVDQLLRRLDYDDFDASELEQLLRWRGSNGESVKVTTWSMTSFMFMGEPKTPTALEALKLLLDCRGDDVGSTNEVICCAASNGRPEVVTMLLNWQPTHAEVVDATAVTAALFRAVDGNNCNLAVVNALLCWKGAAGERATVSDDLIEKVLNPRTALNRFFSLESRWDFASVMPARVA